MTEPGDDLKQRSRGISTDMSPEAIMGRLQKVSDLYEVWTWLRTAKRIGPVDQVREPTADEWQGGQVSGPPEPQEP